MSRQKPHQATRKLTANRLRNRIKLLGLEPEVLTRIGEESKRRGTNRMTMRQINAIIQDVRKNKKSRGI